MLYSIYLGFGTLSNLYIADWILRVNGIGDRMCVQHEAENSLAFFCSHIERHGLHTAHTAPRLSIYQIQIYPNAVCAVFVSVCVLECWLQQKRPVETFRSWLKSGELRMLKKKKGENIVNNWKVRESRGEDLVCELLRRVSLPQGWRGCVRMEHRWVLAQVKL